MSLWRATIRQLGLPPWEFKASKKNYAPPKGYFTRLAAAERLANRNDVLRLIREKGPQNFEEVSAELGLAKQVAHNTLLGAARMGLIERLTDGRYRLLEGNHA